MKKLIIFAALAVSAVFSGCVNCKTECQKNEKSADRLQIGWGKRSIAMPGPVPMTGMSNLRVTAFYLCSGNQQFKRRSDFCFRRYALGKPHCFEPCH